MSVPDGPMSLKEFWPIYLGEHRNTANRWLHVLGSLGGLVWLGLAVYTRNPWLILAGVVNGYAFAWIGHFFIEKNKPATFKHPGKSFLCDWIMLAKTLTFTIGPDLARLEEPSSQAPSEEAVQV